MPEFSDDEQDVGDKLARTVAHSAYFITKGRVWLERLDDGYRKHGSSEDWRRLLDIVRCFVKGESGDPARADAAFKALGWAISVSRTGDKELTFVGEDAPVLVHFLELMEELPGEEVRDQVEHVEAMRNLVNLYEEMVAAGRIQRDSESTERAVADLRALIDGFEEAVVEEEANNWNEFRGLIEKEWDTERVVLTITAEEAQQALKEVLRAEVVEQGRQVRLQLGPDQDPELMRDLMRRAGAELGIKGLIIRRTRDGLVAYVPRVKETKSDRQ